MEDPDSTDLDEDLMAALALSMQEDGVAAQEAGDQTTAEPAAPAEHTEVPEVDDEAEDAPPEAPEAAADDMDDDGEAELLAAMALSLEVSHILSPVHVSDEPQCRVGEECAVLRDLDHNQPRKDCVA